VLFSLTILFAAGCRPVQSFVPGYTPKQLVGTWEDNSGQLTEISRSGGRAVVTSIVDYDGEEFVLQESGVDEGMFHWQYRVPSTGYVVEIWVESIDGDVAQTLWSNLDDQGMSDHGMEQITRAR
jgi:hypothetical protein